MSQSSAPSKTLPSRRAILAALGALPLGGCLGRSTGDGIDLTTRAGGEQLHVATTRRMVGDGTRSPFFDSSRSSRLTYALAKLEGPDRGTLLGKLSSLVRSDFSVSAVDPFEGDGVRRMTEALRGRPTLLFIHGYNQPFEAAALDAELLSKGIGFSGNTALFSWSSKGGLLDYVYDRESALIARDHLADLFSAVLTDPFGAKLHIVAHSMGTLVTLEALRAYHSRNGNAGLDRIGALVFASPDIDRDVFVSSVGRLGAIREKMTVITATNDRALSISRRLAGGDRAGALSPDALQEAGVRVIDATDFASGLIRHDAFIANADVRSVIQRAVERS